MKHVRPILMVVCALWLLIGCSADKGQKLQQLEELEQMNRADSVMRNDSLAEDLVAYFDKHGTPNERMRAHYILGRTYFDLGELPRSLETYLDAAGCADTTAADCDYKTLSRIHAQSAKIYNLQIQPRSQLNELRLAEYYATNARDTLMTIECYAQQADAYSFLQNYDSIIIIREKASKMFMMANKKERSALTIGGAITSLLRRKDIEKARRYIDYYEKFSGSVDSLGNVKNGRKIHYYIKGKYYLAVEKLDSAEYMFRRILSEGNTLNHLIAGNKGLQEVYEHRGIPDSIAKYAKLGYELNDSAYSLSEMQNIQKMQASYNYNHNKQLAEKKSFEAEQANNRLVSAIALIVIVLLAIFLRFMAYRKKKELLLQQYRQDLDNLETAQTELTALREAKEISSSIIERKNEQIMALQGRVKEYQRKMETSRERELEYRLKESPIVKRLYEFANANPPVRASVSDIKELKTLINENIPTFYSTLNTDTYVLTEIEYQVCLLIRTHFSPTEICSLTGISDGYASNIRKRLLEKLYHHVGSPKDFDRIVKDIK